MEFYPERGSLTWDLHHKQSLKSSTSSEEDYWQLLPVIKPTILFASPQSKEDLAYLFKPKTYLQKEDLPTPVTEADDPSEEESSEEEENDVYMKYTHRKFPGI